MCLSPAAATWPLSCLRYRSVTMLHLDPSQSLLLYSLLNRIECLLCLAWIWICRFTTHIYCFLVPSAAYSLAFIEPCLPHSRHCAYCQCVSILFCLCSSVIFLVSTRAALSACLAQECLHRVAHRRHTNRQMPFLVADIEN